MATALVLNGDGSIIPIDFSSRDVGTPFPSNSGFATAIALSIDGETAYVTDYNGGVIPTDVATQINAPEISVGNQILALSVSASIIYLVDVSDGEIYTVDLPSEVTGGPITVGAQPFQAAISPDGTVAYVSNRGDNTVQPIDVLTGIPGAPIAGFSFPRDLVFLPDGSKVYVECDDGTVIPITVASNTIGSAIPVGSFPQAIAVTPDGSTLYVVNNGDSTAQPIDVATETAGVPVVVGANPQELAVSLDGAEVWVVNADDGTVTPIDVATNTALPPISLGGGVFPISIAFTPLTIVIPPPLPRRVVADLPIRTFVTTKEARTLSILDHRATDRQFLWVLNGPAYHTAQVASDDLEINQPFPDADSPANLTNNRRLIYALQRWQGADPPYQPIFGGILMIPEDQGTDTPTTRYTAYDGWQYMMSRPVRNPETGALPGPNGLTFASGSLASDIALGLLEITEIVDGETHIEWYSGDIEASDPLPSTITFDAGLSVGEAWQQLCNTGTIDIHLDPIYEPIDLPGKINRLRIVAQSTGMAAGPVRFNIVMGWDRGGRSLMGVNRLVDGTRLANKVKYFAGQGGVGVPVQTDAQSVTAYGEYWAQQFFPGANDPTIVALLAVAEMAIRRNGDRSLSADPAPERVELPLRDYNLGDYVPVWASRNLREEIGVKYDAFDPDNPGASGYQRIQAIPMEVDDNGIARVRGLLLSGIDVRQPAPPPVTNKVLKAVGSLDNAYAAINLGSDQFEVWVTFRLAFHPPMLSVGGSAFVVLFDDTADFSTFAGLIDDVFVAGSDWSDNSGDATGSIPPPTADTWQVCEVHYTNDGTMEFYVDGDLVFTDSATTIADVRWVWAGASFTGDEDVIYFIDDYKVGTTRGASDLFSDDFEDGTLDAWTASGGDVSVIDDPFL